MDLSDEGRMLSDMIAGEIAGLDGVDPSLNEFIASIFESTATCEDDDAALQAQLDDACGHMADMLLASVPVPEAASEAVAATCHRCRLAWEQMIHERAALHAPRAAAPAGEGGGGEEAAGGEAEPKLVAVDRSKDDTFDAVSEDVRAATLARFYAQEDDSGEQEAWLADTAPATFAEAAARQQAKGGGGGAALPVKKGGDAGGPAKSSFESRIGAMDDFMSELTGSGPGGLSLGPKPGGKGAQRRAKLAAGGRGAAGEDSSSEEDSPATAATALPASRMVEFDPLDIRLDNREFSAYVDRQKREAAKASNEAERQREKEKAEAVRAARELQRNAKIGARAAGK